MNDEYRLEGVTFGKRLVVSVENMPTPEQMESARQAVAKILNRINEDATAALFYGTPPSDKPVPTVCQGNQHVFGMAAEFCQCGKVKS